MPRKVHTEKNEVDAPFVEEVGTDVIAEPESIPTSIVKDTTRMATPRKTRAPRKGGKKSVLNPKEIAQKRSELAFSRFVECAQDVVDKTLRFHAPELILDGWQAKLTIDKIPTFGEALIATVRLEQFAEETELDEAGTMNIWISQTLSTFKLEDDLEGVVMGLIASVQMVYGTADDE